MKINYCLPIIKESKEEVLQMIAKNKHDYQYFEVWVDYLIDVDNEFINQMVEELQDRLLILLRRKNLEPIHMSLERRVEIISLLLNTQSFLDLDISQKEELVFVDNKPIKLILSYHNYQETPDDVSLITLIEEMKKYHPAIYKVVTYCNDKHDAFRLLELQDKLIQQNLKHIVLGMGKFGTITRVSATLSGNEMIFAPATLDESSAPGQMTKQQLEEAFAEKERK